MPKSFFVSYLIFIMAAHSNGQAIIFCSCGFYLLFSYSQRSEIGCIPYFHTWCGLSANLECMSEMCCTWLAENAQRKNYAKNRHLCTTAQLCQAISSQLLRYVSTIQKKLLNNSISSTCPHTMVNVGPLTAEICSGIWGIPANFNGFRVLASLLHRSRLMEANQTCTMFGRLLGWYPIYTFSGALSPWRNSSSCKIYFASMSCILLYWQRYYMALQQRASAKVCSMVQGLELRNFCRGRHLYSAGRLSCWASAQSLVLVF